MTIEDIDLRSLRCFVTVGEELHFGKAAARLNLSQPPLTKRIQSLERDLGVLLFERNTRQVRLTRSGQVLLDEARRLFAQANAMKRAVSRAQTSQGGTLRIAFISSAFISIIKPRLPALTAALGPVEYVWTELSSPEQVEALRRHEVDLAFVHAPAESRGLCSALLANEKCMVAMGRRHPLAQRSYVRLADLADEPFVLFPREIAPAHFDRLIAACGAAGFSPNQRHHARHFLTMLLLPASGSGISIVPSSAQKLAVPGLRLLPIRGTDLRFDLTMLWHPGNSSPLLQRAVKRLGARPASPARPADQVATRT